MPTISNLFLPWMLYKVKQATDDSSKVGVTQV